MLATAKFGDADLTNDTWRSFRPRSPACLLMEHLMREQSAKCFRIIIIIIYALLGGYETTSSTLSAGAIDQYRRSVAAICDLMLSYIAYDCYSYHPHHLHYLSLNHTVKFTVGLFPSLSSLVP